MPLHRRDLLSSAGLFGFSLAVDARHLIGDEQEPPETPRARTVPSPEAPTVRAGVGSEPNMHKVDLAVDVLVAGGGMAGVCAALAAARRGASVMLVQDRSRLGGNASSEIKMHIVGADVHGSRAGWREGGIIEEIRVEDAVRNPHRAWELFDLTLYDLCIREPNLTLHLDSSVYAADVEDGVIRTVHVRCDKTETIHRVTPGICIDATGDGRLALESGADFHEGREPKATYDESLALDEGDDESQGCSILFTAREHDRPMPYTPPPWARKITEDDLLFRGIPYGSYEYGYWWIELGGKHDVIRENEALRFELLRVVLGVWDHIKNSGKHAKSANWALETVGMIPGKRESRRITGLHVQTQQDLQGGWKERDDGVAIGGWGFDEHPSGGFDAWDQPPFYSKPIDEPYNIAFEALVSRNVRNLMMAGRNISNSHVAFTSTRVMATCACTGQAAGTAAALCARDGVTPAELRQRSMGALQQALLEDDQTIRGVTNQDPGDLARSAKVTASDHLPEALPEHVIDGHVRDVPGEWRHRWGARTLDDSGRADAWIQLDIPPMPGNALGGVPWRHLERVQITFDTGFHRELTLSAQNGRSAKMPRRPQPETVRDYRVIGLRPDGEEVVLADVTDNYQRLRRHSFERQPLRAVRVHVSATNGSDTVRIFEIRCT